MAGDFFAEPYNVILFVGVLGTLTIMMSGCYVFHKWQHIKSQNAPTVIIRPKPRRRFRKFLRRDRSGSTLSEKGRNSDCRQMRLEAEGNFNTPVTTPDDILERAITTGMELDDNVFEEVGVCPGQPPPPPISPVQETQNSRNPGESAHSSTYYSVHL